MNKHSVIWYEECLKNREENLEREKKELKLHIECIDSYRVENAILSAQIKRAKEEGRTEFDRDKYNKPRPKKGR